MKKFFVIFMSLNFLLITTFHSYVKAAETVPVPGHPANKEIGKAIIGVLIFAGTGGLVTDQRVRELSSDVWNRTSDGFKEGLATSIDAVRSGTAKGIQFTSEQASELKDVYSQSWTTIYDELAYGEYKSSGSPSPFSRTSSPSRFKLGLSTTPVIVSGGYSAVQITVDNTSDYTAGFVEYAYFSDNNTSCCVRSTVSIKSADISKFKGLYSYEDAKAVFNSLGLYFPSYSLVTTQVPSTSDIGGNFNRTLDSVSTNAINEINVPLDQFLAKSSTGEPLSYDATTGNMTLPSGSTYTGEVAWQVPPIGVTAPYAPGATTAPTYGNPSVPLDGVTVGNPAQPVTVPKTANPAEPVTGEYGGILSTIAGTLSSILAGVTTLVTTFTTGLVGSPSDVQWDKLKGIGTLFTTKFPFSLPWDAKNAMDAVFGGFAVKDKLTFDFEVEFNGKTYPFDLTIEKMFMDWFGFARIAILILFDIGMIYAIRQWFGGAS